MAPQTRKAMNLKTESEMLFPCCVKSVPCGSVAPSSTKDTFHKVPSARPQNEGLRQVRGIAVLTSSGVLLPAISMRFMAMVPQSSHCQRPEGSWSWSPGP